MNRFVSLGILALALTPAGALADSATMDKAANAQMLTNQTPGSVFSSDLVGQAVYGPGDEKIGDINDILISGTGGVDAVVIGIGGFLGMGEKDVAVPLEQLDIAIVDDGAEISIDATEMELQSAPAFARADGTTSDRLGSFERYFNRASEDAKKALSAVSERATGLYNRAADAASDATDATVNAASDARDAVSETANSAMETINDTAEDVSQSVTGAGEKAADATQDAAEATAETADEAVENAASAVEEAGDKAERTVQ